MGNGNAAKSRNTKPKRALVNLEKEKMLTPAEICRLMEFSRSKLHLELATGDLPYFRMKALIRVKESDFLRWLETKKIEN